MDEFEMSFQDVSSGSDSGSNSEDEQGQGADQKADKLRKK